MTGNEAALGRAQYLSLLWPVRQSGAAIEPNDIILKAVFPYLRYRAARNLMLSGTDFCDVKDVLES